MPKTVVILATMDTKEEEAVFLKGIIEKRGHRVLIVDAGILREPGIAADVPRREVALAGGASIDELLKAGNKGRAVENMIRGAASIVSKLYSKGRFDGIIGIGGAQGTAIGTSAMRALPFGVPKLMVSTVASGQARFGDFVGASDMTIMHSVVDMCGVNSLSAVVLENAASAIVGMVETQGKESTVGVGFIRPESAQAVDANRRIAMTVLGNTTPAAVEIRKLLAEKGYEVVCFHCNGTGGIAMERMVADGYFGAVLDLTAHELIDREFGGLHAAIDSNRLEEAGRAGIPQVVVPSCVDYLVLGPPDSLPSRFRGRQYVVHNPDLTLVRASREEMKRVGEVMAEKINKSKGAVAVVLPLRGLSMHNAEGKEFYDPETDRAFYGVLKEKLRPGIPVHEVDAHVNDRAFASAAAGLLLAMMQGRDEEETCD